MRRALTISTCVIAASLVIAAAPSIQAKDLYSVANMYYLSAAYPESFDEFVLNNKSIFDAEFFSCLDSLEKQWIPQAQQETANCNLPIDQMYPQLKQNCLSTAKYLSFLTWSGCLRAVLTGQSRWQDTIRGQQATLGKTYARMAGDENKLWVQPLQTSMDTLRPYFLCKRTSP